MWTCPHCSEEIEDSFDACWKCGTCQDGAPAEDFQPVADDPSVPDPGPGAETPECAPAGAEAASVDDLVTIATYDLPTKAAVERLALEEEGIPTFLDDDNLVAMDWLLSNAIGGVKLKVAAANAPRAMEILEVCRAASTRPRTAGCEREITFACEECGGQITFPGERRGRVEVCPRCGRYVDVPESTH
jgi:hypothetical protein